MKKVILFDAYGTLFDVYSIAAALEALFPSRGAALAVALRDTQISYTRLVTTSNGGVHYKPFDAITLAALKQVCGAVGLTLSDAQAAQVMAQYNTLTAFPDALATLTVLKQAGYTTGILSNGTPAMLAAATQSAGLAGVLDHVLSIDTLNPPQYKTAPAAYRLGAVATDTPVTDIIFVSSNAWDALGATWFGYQTLWVNRSGAPFEALGELTQTKPAHTVHQLAEIPALFI